VGQRIRNIPGAAKVRGNRRESEIVSVLDYDTFSELQFGVPKPDFGAAGLSAVLSSQQFATPRQLRIGIRYEF
jgi:hypothetical protein